MHKFCIPVFALALGAPALTRAAEPAAGATVAASAKITVSDQDALNDDILATIDLPLAAADAREAGVDEAELKDALTTTQASGLPASEATEVVSVEADQTRTRGAKKGFGTWVRKQVAAGLRGKKLADKVKQRKEDAAPLDDKAAADLQTKLDKQREVNVAWRAKWEEKRKELVGKGKKVVIANKERHDKLKAKIDAAEVKLDDRQAKIDDKQDATTVRLRELEAKLSTASDADKPALEAEKVKLERQLGRLEKRDAKLDKADTKLDKADTKLDTKAEGKIANHPTKPIPRPGPPENKAADKKIADKPVGSAAQ